MVFICRVSHLLDKFPPALLFTVTTSGVTVSGNCDQGLLWFDEECNSGLIFIAGF